MRRPVGFLFRGRREEIGDAATARMTLLEWLRTRRQAVGSKEGCAEGDCGACTVILARSSGGGIALRPVNACILMVGQAHGAAVFTIEDLARPDGTLHPVQRAMMDRHGAQCGFCTPGIVTSLAALHETGPRPLGREAVLDQLAGNLCRCTGYRPILEAALDAAAAPPIGLAEAIRWEQLEDDASADVLVGDERAFFAAPASETALQRLLAAHPESLVLAGGTDAGLWLTKGLQQPVKVIWLGRVAGLDAIEPTADGLSLGATVPLALAASHLARLAPDLGEVMRRFGSVQVRSSGTIGGNIANASPIGDLAPCLIALGATLELGSAAGVRTMPLEDFFLAYRKQDRRPGEYVRRLLVPSLPPSRHLKAFKVSKRMDEDISAVLAAFCLELDGARVTSARIAFGGMAGIPARARGTEQALVGALVDDAASWQPALAALETDFTPIDDHRASAAYRRLVAGNLLRKALMELAGTPVETIRLAPPREAAHAG